jgi:hypothetical protein
MASGIPDRPSISSLDFALDQSQSISDKAFESFLKSNTDLFYSLSNGLTILDRVQRSTAPPFWMKIVLRVSEDKVIEEGIKSVIPIKDLEKIVCGYLKP